MAVAQEDTKRGEGFGFRELPVSWTNPERPDLGQRLVTLRAMRGSDVHDSPVRSPFQLNTILYPAIAKFLA